MLYRTPGFANALGYDEQHPRPDMLAVVARREADIVGIAAVSADSERLWQVGVDVVPEARGSGLGRALVSRLTAELLEREIVPFYATGIANIASRRLAASVGYWPAWTEVYARDLPAQ
jgi:predicted GNAT family acetyltransferase